MRKMYKIAVISDKESWINPYLCYFVQQLQSKGYEVFRGYEFDKKNSYDIVFLLSYSQIIKRKDLARNRHNLVVHESDLPKGKGWSPLTWQILEGKSSCVITLFEADEKVDNGEIYLQRIMNFAGNELIDELREIQARHTIEMCIEFICDYENIIRNVRPQVGIATHYPRRTLKDSELDVQQTIEEQFNLLRIVDNEKYPAYFYMHGQKYIIKIYKHNS
ncbi:formyltransferase family protein [Sporomusa sphaeroides]|uniref:formyltransferase family protein n=1 Tax=Sporomusa sphaeroides TaxID=47679 RepID=UPI0031598810